MGAGGGWSTVLPLSGRAVYIICALKLICLLGIPGVTRWRSCLRHSAASRKVAGSVPDVVSGTFHWRNPSCRTMALGSTQTLTEFRTRGIYGGKGSRCLELTALPRSGAGCPEILGASTCWALMACPGLEWDSLTFYYIYIYIYISPIPPLAQCKKDTIFDSSNTEMTVSYAAYLCFDCWRRFFSSCVSLSNRLTAFRNR